MMKIEMNGIKLEVVDPYVEKQIQRIILGDVGVQKKGARILGARPWTAQEDSQLLELKSNGLSNKEIGQKLGRTPVAIQVRSTRLNK